MCNSIFGRYAFSKQLPNKVYIHILDLHLTFAEIRSKVFAMDLQWMHVDFIAMDLQWMQIYFTVLCILGNDSTYILSSSDFPK